MYLKCGIFPTRETMAEAREQAMDLIDSVLADDSVKRVKFLKVYDALIGNLCDETMNDCYEEAELGGSTTSNIFLLTAVHITANTMLKGT